LNSPEIENERSREADRSRPPPPSLSIPRYDESPGLGGCGDTIKTKKGVVSKQRSSTFKRRTRAVFEEGVVVWALCHMDRGRHEVVL